MTAVAWGAEDVLCTIGEGRHLLVPTADLSLAPLLALYGEYEAEFTSYLRAYLQPGMTFVDVGANVGLFTVIGAAAVGATGRVVAYEPNPAVLPYLTANVAFNWQAGWVRVVPRAAHRDTEERALRVPRRWAGAASFTTNGVMEQIAALGAVAWDTVLVACERLDTLEGFIHLVKIDVEGGEADVLAGMAGLLQQRRVGVIALEYRADVIAQEQQEPMRVALAGLVEHYGARFAVPAQPSAAIPLDTVLATAHYSQLLVVLQ